MPIVELQDGRQLEFQSNPTPQDVDFAVQQLGSQSQQNQFFTPSGITLDDSQYTNSFSLPFGDNLALSFMPNDEKRIQFLADKYRGSNVSSDPEKGITIDNKPINPKGFDVGDISRNAGSIFPLAGHILGSIVGFTGGATIASPTVAGIPVAAGAGAMAGATAFAGIGEGIRLGIGDILGLDVEGKEYYDRITDEIKLAAASEAIGLGIAPVLGKVATAMGRGRALKGSADFLKKNMNNVSEKLGVGTAKTYAHYVGGVEKHFNDALFQPAIGGPNKVFTPEIMAPDKLHRVINKVLFGKEIVSDSILNRTSTETADMGLKMMAKSLKKINNQQYDDLIGGLMGASDDLIQTIKAIPEDKLFSKEFLNPSKGAFIANSFSHMTKKKTEALGKKIAGSERILANAANKTGVKFSFKQSQTFLKNQIKQLKSATRAGEEGIIPAIKLRKLEELEDMMVQMSKQGTDTALEKINPGAFVKIKNNMDTQIKNLFERGEADIVVKDAARRFAEKMRNEYYEKIGFKAKVFERGTGIKLSQRQGKEISDFRMFQEVLEDLHMQGGKDITAQVQNLLKGLSRVPKKTTAKVLTTPQERMRKFISANKEFSKHIDDMAIFDATTQMKVVQSRDVFAKFEKMLRRPELVQMFNDPIGEIFLKNVDNIMPAGRKFLNDAIRVQVANAFQGQTINMLRLTAIASMMGIGAMGFGPAGIAGAAVLTQPSVTRGMIKAIHKTGLKGKATGQAVSKGAEKISNVKAMKAIKRILKKESLKAGVERRAFGQVGVEALSDLLQSQPNSRP